MSRTLKVTLVVWIFAALYTLVFFQGFVPAIDTASWSVVQKKTAKMVGMTVAAALVHITDRIVHKKLPP